MTKCTTHDVPLVRTEVEFGKEVYLCPLCQKDKSKFLADEWNKEKDRQQNSSLVAILESALCAAPGEELTIIKQSACEELLVMLREHRQLKLNLRIAMKAVLAAFSYIEGDPTANGDEIAEIISSTLEHPDLAEYVEEKKC